LGDSNLSNQSLGLITRFSSLLRRGKLKSNANMVGKSNTQSHPICCPNFGEDTWKQTLGRDDKPPCPQNVPNDEFVWYISWG
jgi:hypothetical protein